jgi:hypothetical protein
MFRHRATERRRAKIFGKNHLSPPRVTENGVLRKRVMTALGTSLRCPSCSEFYETLADLYDAGGRLYRLGIVTKAECGSCGKRWAVCGPVKIVNHKTNYRLEKHDSH